MHKKRIIICILSAFAIIIFTLLSTILWYKFFKQNMKREIENTTNEVSEVYISNNGPQVIKDIALDDEGYVGNDSGEYSFSVENTGKEKVSYKLLLIDTPLSSLTDGCTSDKLLKREQLVYELYCNGKKITKENMNKISDNIIDIKTIDAGGRNEYKLKFYIQNTATNYLNKHYHYEVDLSF